MASDWNDPAGLFHKAAFLLIEVVLVVCVKSFISFAWTLFGLLAVWRHLVVVVHLSVFAPFHGGSYFPHRDLLCLYGRLLVSVDAVLGAEVLLCLFVSGLLVMVFIFLGHFQHSPTHTKCYHACLTR